MIMQIGEFSLAKHVFWASELSPFHVRIHCIPCCGPELGVSLAVEGVMSLVGVFCFPVV